MSKIFVSHSHKDADLVELFVRLLKFHDFDPWYSGSDLRLGKFTDAIRQNLALADILVVVVSKNAMESQWVLEEITRFVQAGQGKAVIPLQLDQTQPRDLLASLDQYQAFPFSDRGLDRLFGALGVGFLTKERRWKERRSGVDR